MNIGIIFIIAVSLSMDAFSLSLAYGTLAMTKRSIFGLSVVVGMYHFFMPLIGSIIGMLVVKVIPFSYSKLTFIILLVIGISMVIECFKKQEDYHSMSMLEMFGFGLAVSIDSFSVGVGLVDITNNYLVAASVFSVMSLIFTYIGLKLGKVINLLVGSISTLLGGIILIILSFFYL